MILHFAFFDAEDVVGFAMLAMVVAGLSIGAVVFIVRELALQRIRENLLRERIARHWATVHPVTPPASR